MQCSSRHRRRLLKKEKQKCLNRLLNKSDWFKEIELANGTTNDADINVVEVEEASTHIEVDEVILKDKLIGDLGQWQLSSRTSQKHMRELLCI